MIDELSRIEGTYGSVAEYNRVQEEEGNYNEPSEEEIASYANKLETFDKKRKILNGEPSAYAKMLNELWTEMKLSENADSYMWREYRSIKATNCVDRIGSYYEKPFSSDVNFFRTTPGTFAIRVEYEDLFGTILSTNVVDLDYESFKNIFRDLDYLNLRPTMSYRLENTADSVILTNIDLGTLRMNDLKQLGFETEGGLEAEIQEALS